MTKNKDRSEGAIHLVDAIAQTISPHDEADGYRRIKLSVDKFSEYAGKIHKNYYILYFIPAAFTAIIALSINYYLTSYKFTAWVIFLFLVTVSILVNFIIKLKIYNQHKNEKLYIKFKDNMHFIQPVRYLHIDDSISEIFSLISELGLRTFSMHGGDKLEVQSDIYKSYWAILLLSECFEHGPKVVSPSGKVYRGVIWIDREHANVLRKAFDALEPPQPTTLTHNLQSLGTPPATPIASPVRQNDTPAVQYGSAVTNSGNRNTRPEDQWMVALDDKQFLAGLERLLDQKVPASYWETYRPLMHLIRDEMCNRGPADSQEAMITKIINSLIEKNLPMRAARRSYIMNLMHGKFRTEDFKPLFGDDNG